MSCYLSSLPAVEIRINFFKFLIYFLLCIFYLFSVYFRDTL